MTTTDGELAARLLVLKLSRVGPARARWLLEENTAVEVVSALRHRRLPVSGAAAPKGVTSVLVERWFSEVREIDGSALLGLHRAAGQVVIGPDERAWPFGDDPDPPVVLFAAGHLDALDQRPKVAVIGTRRCSSIGRRVADGLGSELSVGGAGVVSGLALGIDGAAHLGALAVVGARPIGVVATGLDRVYPANHATLWTQMIDRGLLLSEAPLGTAPERWRFPARNRLIASLSDLVVIVESHHSGGALLTADEAAARGVPVAVVPGSVTSPASDGTNGLLFDGCIPVRGSGDVLEFLGLSQQPTVKQLALPQESPDAKDLVLAEVAAGAVHVDALVAVTDRSLGEVLQLVQALHLAGEVVLDGGWVARP